jgi:hypothetical protein
MLIILLSIIEVVIEGSIMFDVDENNEFVSFDTFKAVNMIFVCSIEIFQIDVILIFFLHKLFEYYYLNYYLIVLIKQWYKII